jgi:hypothetical protein
VASLRQRIGVVAGAVVLLATSLLSGAPAFASASHVAPDLMKITNVSVVVRTMSLTWIDRSDDEDLFRIFQRKLNGTLEWLTDVATIDKPGTGQAMTRSVVVPTDTDCSGLLGAIRSYGLTRRRGERRCMWATTSSRCHVHGRRTGR